MYVIMLYKLEMHTKNIQYLVFVSCFQLLYIFIFVYLHILAHEPVFYIIYLNTRYLSISCILYHVRHVDVDIICVLSGEGEYDDYNI